jgi:hypothetical protein
MTEFDVIRKDAIRLATAVVNLSKKYEPFKGRAGGLAYKALSTRQLAELEQVCEELRTVYCKLLTLERDYATLKGERLGSDEQIFGVDEQIPGRALND